jgi:hypothetical protein
MTVITKFIGGAADGTEAKAKQIDKMPEVLRLDCQETGQKLVYRLRSNVPEVRIELVYRYELEQR